MNAAGMPSDDHGVPHTDEAHRRCRDSTCCLKLRDLGAVPVLVGGLVQANTRSHRRFSDCRRPGVSKIEHTRFAERI